jgi:FkbM family methyltransferase
VSLVPFLLSRGTFRDDPILVTDVGASGGVHPVWLQFGDQCRVTAYEPDAAECQRLQAEAPPWVEYRPIALGAMDEERPFYSTRNPHCSGLYKAHMAYMGRFLNGQNNEAVSERIIRTLPLGRGAGDFLKLDAEGAELDILQGADLRDTLGIFTEVRFHSESNGCPTFSEVDLYLRQEGFRLYGLKTSQHSRKVMPYPDNGSGKRGRPAYTTKGQVQDGDAIYFRDLPGFVWSRMQVLKAACLFEMCDLCDCAAELVSNCRELICNPLADECLAYLRRAIV